MTEQRIQQLKHKLQEARYAAIVRNPDFALPLRYMRYIAVDDAMPMSTNGTCIFVNPSWLKNVGLPALEFLLAHQQMHILLGHIDRSRYYAGERFHLACDIVANSHLRELGYEYDQLPGVGKLYHMTFYPSTEGRELTAEQAFRQVPFDPAALKDKKSTRFVIDSDAYWSRKEDRGVHGVLLLSPLDHDPEDLRLDALLDAKEKSRRKGRLKRHPEEIRGIPDIDLKGDMDRKKPGSDRGDKEQLANLSKLRKRKAQDEQAAAMDAAHRIWQRPNDPRLDWKSLLDSFLQEQLSDYSFLPPDRRQMDSEFFLPDFNETEISPQRIAFAVDTSGSIDDELLSAVFSEICAAIEQFDGRLTGVLLFFDTRVYAPIPFSDVADLENAIPVGGGGTDFSSLFSYLAASPLNPASLVIFTDGQGEIPDERAAGNLPVLWLLSKADADIPWGKQALLRKE